jgi:hypothetical protein
MPGAEVTARARQCKSGPATPPAAGRRRPCVARTGRLRCAWEACASRAAFARPLPLRSAAAMRRSGWSLALRLGRPARHARLLPDHCRPPAAGAGAPRPSPAAADTDSHGRMDQPKKRLTTDGEPTVNDALPALRRSVCQAALYGQNSYDRLDWHVPLGRLSAPRPDTPQLPPAEELRHVECRRRRARPSRSAMRAPSRAARPRGVARAEASRCHCQVPRAGDARRQGPLRARMR